MRATLWTPLSQNPESAPGDYLQISFRFQNTLEEGVAFQLATFRHQYTWENGFVWEMRGSERLTNPPLKEERQVAFLLTCCCRAHVYASYT